MEDKTFKQAEKLLTKRFLAAMEDGFSQEVFRLREWVTDCKSEIEQMFLLGWMAELSRRKMIGASCGGHSDYHIYAPGTSVELKTLVPPGLNEWHVIIPQYPVENYRVDFMLGMSQRWPNAKAANFVQFIVECDGHDFHEKTKQQAAKDKTRDRFLQSCGYPVLHFTGSEIWNRLDECIDEVVDFMESKIDKR
jgi:very-short-patch-repair endonuclease